MAQSRQPRVGYCYWASVAVCIGQVLGRWRRPLSTVQIYRSSAETGPSTGPIPSLLLLLLWHPVSKVEEPESGPWTAHYWAMCHFYRSKPFWKWKNKSWTQHRPIAVPISSVGGQSLGQNWSPSVYRSYHFSNGTILATDLRQIFGDARPVLGRIYLRT